MSDELELQMIDIESMADVARMLAYCIDAGCDDGGGCSDCMINTGVRNRIDFDSGNRCDIMNDVLKAMFGDEYLEYEREEKRRLRRDAADRLRACDDCSDYALICAMVGDDLQSPTDVRDAMVRLLTDGGRQVQAINDFVDAVVRGDPDLKPLGIVNDTRCNEAINRSDDDDAAGIGAPMIVPLVYVRCPWCGNEFILGGCDRLCDNYEMYGNYFVGEYIECSHCGRTLPLRRVGVPSF